MDMWLGHDSLQRCALVIPPHPSLSGYSKGYLGPALGPPPSRPVLVTQWVPGVELHSPHCLIYKASDVSLSDPCLWMRNRRLAEADL